MEQHIAAGKERDWRCLSFKWKDWSTKPNSENISNNVMLRLSDSVRAQWGFCYWLRQPSLIIFQTSTVRQAGGEITALSDSLTWLIEHCTHIPVFPSFGSLFIYRFFFKIKIKCYEAEVTKMTFLSLSFLFLFVSFFYSCCAHTPWPLTHQTIKNPQLKPSYNSFIGDTNTHTRHIPTHKLARSRLCVCWLCC